VITSLLAVSDVQRRRSPLRLRSRSPWAKIRGMSDQPHSAHDIEALAVRYYSCGHDGFSCASCDPFFSALYETCWRMLWGIFTAYHLQPAECDDLFQEVVLRIDDTRLRGTGYVAERGSFRTYLHKMATNLTLDYLRGRKRVVKRERPVYDESQHEEPANGSVRLPPVWQPDLADSEVGLLQNEMLKKVEGQYMATWEALSKKDQLLLSVSHGALLSLQDIAAHMKQPIVDLTQRLLKADAARIKESEARMLKKAATGVATKKASRAFQPTLPKIIDPNQRRDDWANEEIAAILGISRGTASTLTQKAERTLHRLHRERGGACHYVSPLQFGKSVTVGARATRGLVVDTLPGHFWKASSRYTWLQFAVHSNGNGGTITLDASSLLVGSYKATLWIHIHRCDDQSQVGVLGVRITLTVKPSGGELKEAKQ
jgi:RNA polymerase sigma factor (sigma-70 family)